ncbi:MAG: type II toxin-antitoxin system VapB family antitoxin [Ferruginibacter sp.]|nr:type II toxin-antitoxin system VapB family antitoxin [Rhodoferax sp.]
MRTTITIDDALFASAAALLPQPAKPSEVVAHALKAMLQADAIRHLIDMGGKAPHMQDIPRRRPEEFVTK